LLFSRVPTNAKAKHWNFEIQNFSSG